MADVTKLKLLLDVYGVGVRAGTITPQSEDEKYFREIMGIPEMSKEVLGAWDADGNFRRPITLAQNYGPPQAGVNQPTEEGEDDEI